MENIDRLSPYVRASIENTIYFPYVVDRVILDYELLYVKNGTVRVEIEDRKYNGVAGDLFLIKPGLHHVINIGDPHLTQIAVHFDLFERPDSPEVKVSFKPMSQLTASEIARIRPDVCSEPSFFVPEKMKLPYPKPIEKLMTLIAEEFERKLPYSRIALKGLCTQLWIAVLRQLQWDYNQVIRKHLHRLDQVKAYLETHPEENVSIASLARMANLSRYYFMRLFKETFGASPLHYHQIAKIEKSKQMLQYSSAPVQEIASRLGYGSLHSFSRAFKRIEGVPPTFYRHS